MATAEKVIETSPIRLTSDETRMLIRAAAANGKPVEGYNACSLEALGILKAVVVPGKSCKEQINECWREVKKAAAAEDAYDISRQLSKITDFKKTEKATTKGYVLTDLGKQVSRGISIRINSQFKGAQC